MEGRLFILAIWCGIYGYAIRVMARRDNCLERPVVTMAMNSLFWATFLSMVGMLVASYSEKLDRTTQFSLGFAAIGLVIGAVTAFFKTKKVEDREALISDNLEWADTGFSAILLASFVMFFVVQAFKIPSGSMRMTFVEGDHLFVNKYVYGIPVPLSEKRLLPGNVGIPLGGQNKLTIFKKIERGDIVIFRFPAKNKDNPHYGKDFIKRCIALEGQKVQIIDKEVFIDGVKQDEPYKQHVENMVYPGSAFAPDDFQQKWQTGLFEGLGGNEIRDNFGPVVVPEGCIFVMGDNRDRSFDGRFWGPLKVSLVKGKAWMLYWPLNRFKFAK